MLYRVSLSQQHCVTAWRQSVIQQLTVPLSRSAVRALGVIEYIHPSFHDEKYLWPVSLHAVRASHTSLHCGKWSEILHLRRPYHAVHRANTSTLAQVGYMAERVTATPASRHKPVVHRCEVLAAPDGSGPLFR